MGYSVTRCFAERLLLHKLKHSLPVARTDLVTICETVPYAFFKNKTQYSFFFRLNVEVLGWIYTN